MIFSIITFLILIISTIPFGTAFNINELVFSTENLNNPPFFGSAYPLNNSINNSLSLIFSIPIYDAEGDKFSWTIQCINGQTTSATNASNGTKYLVIDGLVYATTYKVWVNATDSTGSGLYTRRWCVFTTKVNEPPVFGSPIPTNNSTNSLWSFNWRIPINDTNGDFFSWEIECNNGQINSDINAYNGTKSLSLNSLSNSTTYTIWVNATDPTGSGLYTRRWYTFTTKENEPPVFGSPIPANDSIDLPQNVNWSIAINDSDGDVFSWTIQCNNGQTTSGTGASNGIKILALSDLANSTTYKVWVNATDPTGSDLYTREWYIFTTKVNQCPVFGLPTPTNSSNNNPWNLIWSIAINDSDGDVFSWTIQCNNGQTTSGTGAKNGIKSLALSGLANATTYKVWVNATDPTGSGLYMRKWYNFITQTSNPPDLPIIDGPAYGDARASYNYNFIAVDPDGNDVYYKIEWDDGSPITEWIGPYPSGQNCIVSHTFSKADKYMIKCQAKDTYGSMSDWGELEVTMPTRTLYISSFFFDLIEKLIQRCIHTLFI